MFEAVRLFDSYLAAYPHELEKLAGVRDACIDFELRDRNRLPGHLTASALVLSADFQRVALVEHRKLGRLLQPGGHVDPDEFPLAAARREVAEEIGVTNVKVVKSPGGAEIPWEIDLHVIGARGGMPAHMHYDFRYVLVCAEEDVRLAANPDETRGAKWQPLWGLPRVTNLREIHDRLIASL